MRTFLIIVLVGVVAGMAGWITYASTNESASISLNTDKIKEDVEDATDAVRDVVDETAESIEEVDQEIEDSRD